MEMQQIRYFLSLARTLNFTRAAEDCNVTQPALTRAIQALEAELGGDLIRRERGNSHLTELGKRMLPLLERCFESASTAKALANSIGRQEVSPLSMAVSHTVNLEIAMKPVTELFRSVPGLQLQLRRGGGREVLEMLKEGEAEIALAGPIEDTWERLDHWPLFDERLELAVHQEHALAFGNDLSLSRLTGQTIFMQTGCEMRDEVVRALQDQGLSLASLHEVVTHQDVVTLLSAGLGVAIVPASAPHHDAIRRAPISDLTLTRQVSVFAAAGRRREPAATTLLNLLRSADYAAPVHQAPSA